MELPQKVPQGLGIGKTALRAAANGGEAEVQVSQGMGPDLTLGRHDAPAPLPFAEPFTVAYPPAVRGGQAGDVGIRVEMTLPSQHVVTLT